MAAHRFNFLLTTRCFWSSSSFSKPNNPTVALRPVANTNRLFFFFTPKPLLPSFGIIASPTITTSSSCTTDQTSSSSFEAATAATSSEKRPSSGNYKPSIWTHEVLKTLKNDYEGEIYQRRVESLKDNVRKLLQKKVKGSIVSLLELVDDIQRLGMECLFEEEISIALDSIKEMPIGDDLYARSIHFRIFRQHGFAVSQDTFIHFKDLQGNFIENLGHDSKGILSLYDASYLGIIGEDILDDAKRFARKHLNIVNENINPVLVKTINHALEVPRNLRFIMLEARWYIDTYSEREDSDSDLLELAKLNYNMVQGIYQRNAINTSRWWKDLGLVHKLPFVRDRLMECFLGAMGTIHEPQYDYCREEITKVMTFVPTIDDIYDTHATLDEAKFFTDAIERWDVNSMDKLSDYMQLCLFALYNTINKIAYDTLRDKGLNVLPYLRKMWVDYCKSYLVEAKWFHTGYKPTFEEYLDNGYISVSAPMLLLHIYVLMSPQITKEALYYISTYPNLVRSLGMIIRLLDDMGSYECEIVRGDILKSIPFYMHDKGVTEVVARDYIRHLTDEEWKKLNSELWTKSPLPQDFIKAVVNFARMTESLYQYGDGVSIQERGTKDNLIALLVNNIPIV